MTAELDMMGPWALQKLALDLEAASVPGLLPAGETHTLLHRWKELLTAVSHRWVVLQSL